MRPVYHQKTPRVEGHIFITLLAYNLVHQIRLDLKAKGINDSWETIRTTLCTQMRTTASLRGEGGELIHLRKSSYPLTFLTVIYSLQVRQPIIISFNLEKSFC